MLSKKTGKTTQITSGGNFSPECTEFHRCKLQDSLGQARQIVGAALSKLQPISQGVATKERVIDLLNVHFHTASTDNIRKILDNFRFIESELNAPITYICHDGVPASCEGFTGGFTDCGVSCNDVHLCAPYFVSFTCEQRAHAHVHEAVPHIKGFLCHNEVYVGVPEYSILSPERL